MTTTHRTTDTTADENHPAPAHRPLTADRLRRLHTVIDAARRGARVKRQTDEGHVIEAEARHIVLSREDNSFPGPDTDVRDCVLRVTAVGGLGVDYHWSVGDLAEELGEDFHTDTP